MRFVGRGHPAIRATHAKTLELTADADDHRAGHLRHRGRRPSRAAAPMAGPVRITITAGRRVVHARRRRQPVLGPGRPGGDPARPAAAARHVRHRRRRRGGRPAPRAGRRAAGPDARVEVDVVPIPADAGGRAVRRRPGPAAGRPGAGRRTRPPPTRSSPRTPAPAGWSARAADAAGRTAGRTLVVATADLPGQTVLGALRDVARRDRRSAARAGRRGGLPVTRPAAARPGRRRRRDLLRDDTGRAPASS